MLSVPEYERCVARPDSPFETTNETENERRTALPPEIQKGSKLNVCVGEQYCAQKLVEALPKTR